MNLYFVQSDIDSEKDEEGFYNDCVNQFKKAKKYFKGNNLKFLDFVDRENLLDENFDDYLSDLITTWADYGIKPSDMVFALFNDFRKKTFSDEELEKIKEIEESSKKYGITFGVYDYEDVYGYKEVKKANDLIKQEVNFMKKSKFSPLEKLLYAYLKVEDRVYTSEGDDDSNSKSRSVYGILNSDKIVCAGYSEQLKAIIRECEDENLKVFANDVGTFDKEDEKDPYGLHQNNIVYIKDDKYKIDGFYYLDPTWDSKKKFTEEDDLSDLTPEKIDYRQDKNQLRYFLTEIGQIKNLKYDDILTYWETVPKTSGYTNPIPYHKRHNEILNMKCPDYISVSGKKVDLDDVNEFYAVNIDRQDLADNALKPYLLSRQDFKDYVILKQTETDFNRKNKKSTKQFNVTFDKNYKTGMEDITKLKAFYGQKAIWRYLDEHSPHIDMGAVNDALHVVFKKMNPEKSKDEIASDVHHVVKTNIQYSKDIYNEDAQTLWTECENLEK